MASGTGLLNPNLRDWDPDVLRELEIGVERVSPLASARESVVGLRKEFAERWPALKDVPWVPGDRRWGGEQRWFRLRDYRKSGDQRRYVGSDACLLEGSVGEDSARALVLSR
jgi:hypothetical protein